LHNIVKAFFIPQIYIFHKIRANFSDNRIFTENMCKKFCVHLHSIQSICIPQDISAKKMFPSENNMYTLIFSVAFSFSKFAKMRKRPFPLKPYSKLGRDCIKRQLFHLLPIYTRIFFCFISSLRISPLSPFTHTNA
jgi:hypothetical protein